MALIVAEQKNRIAEQAEQIEKLHESDNELQRSRQLLRGSERLLKESEQKLSNSLLEKQKAVDLKDKAETEMRQARVEKAQAEEKSQKLQTIIDAKIRERAKRLEQKQKQAIKEKSADIFAKVGAVTYALIGWNVALTITLLIHDWHIVSTAPQWFVNRWSNIVWIANGIETIFVYFYELLQRHMHDFFAGVISLIPPIVICAVVAILGYIAYDYVKTQWTDIWEHYDRYDKTLLKATTTTAIVIGSMPLATWLAGFDNPINVLSWWLMLSLGLNIAYHAITYRQY